MNSTRFLPTVLGVLDEADGAQSRMDEVTKWRSRDFLLNAVQQLDTDHSPAALVEGVDGYLARAATSSGATMKKTVLSHRAPFSFGWERPTSVAEQARQVILIQPKRWWQSKWAGWGRKNAAVVGIVGLLLIGLGLFCYLCGGLFAFGADLFHAGPVTRQLALLTGWVAGFFSSLVGVNYLEHRDKQRGANEDDDTIDQEKPFDSSMCAWADNDRYMENADYLKYPSTRAYLRAVLESPLPRLMCEDCEQLECLFLKGEVEALQLKVDALIEQKRQRMAAGDDKTSVGRMETLAAALAEQPD